MAVVKGRPYLRFQEKAGFTRVLSKARGGAGTGLQRRYDNLGIAVTSKITMSW
jgi:hypothetical protein